MPPRRIGSDGSGDERAGVLVDSLLGSQGPQREPTLSEPTDGLRDVAADTAALDAIASGRGSIGTFRRPSPFTRKSFSITGEEKLPGKVSLSGYFENGTVHFQNAELQFEAVGFTRMGYARPRQLTRHLSVHFQDDTLIVLTAELPRMSLDSHRITGSNLNMERIYIVVQRKGQELEILPEDHNLVRAAYESQGYPRGPRPRTLFDRIPTTVLPDAVFGGRSQAYTMPDDGVLPKVPKPSPTQIKVLPATVPAAVAGADTAPVSVAPETLPTPAPPPGAEDIPETLLPKPVPEAAPTEPVAAPVPVKIKAPKPAKPADAWLTTTDSLAPELVVTLTALKRGSGSFDYRDIKVTVTYFGQPLEVRLHRKGKQKPGSTNVIERVAFAVQFGPGKPQSFGFGFEERADGLHLNTANRQLITERLENAVFDEIQRFQNAQIAPLLTQISALEEKLNKTLDGLLASEANVGDLLESAGKVREVIQHGIEVVQNRANEYEDTWLEYQSSVERLRQQILEVGLEAVGEDHLDVPEQYRAYAEHSRGRVETELAGFNEWMSGITADIAAIAAENAARLEQLKPPPPPPPPPPPAPPPAKYVAPFPLQEAYHRGKTSSKQSTAQWVLQGLRYEIPLTRKTATYQRRGKRRETLVVEMFEHPFNFEGMTLLTDRFSSRTFKTGDKPFPVLHFKDETTGFYYFRTWPLEKGKQRFFVLWGLPGKDTDRINEITGDQIPEDVRGMFSLNFFGLTDIHRATEVIFAKVAAAPQKPTGFEFTSPYTNEQLTVTLDHRRFSSKLQEDANALQKATLANKDGSNARELTVLNYPTLPYLYDKVENRWWLYPMMHLFRPAIMELQEAAIPGVVRWACGQNIVLTPEYTYTRGGTSEDPGPSVYTKAKGKQVAIHRKQIPITRDWTTSFFPLLFDAAVADRYLTEQTIEWEGKTIPVSHIPSVSDDFFIYVSADTNEPHAFVEYSGVRSGEAYMMVVPRDKIGREFLSIVPVQELPATKTFMNDDGKRELHYGIAGRTEFVRLELTPKIPDPKSLEDITVHAWLVDTDTGDETNLLPFIKEYRENGRPILRLVHWATRDGQRLFRHAWVGGRDSLQEFDRQSDVGEDVRRTWLEVIVESAVGLVNSAVGTDPSAEPQLEAPTPGPSRPSTASPAKVIRRQRQVGTEAAAGTGHSIEETPRPHDPASGTKASQSGSIIAGNTPPPPHPLPRGEGVGGGWPNARVISGTSVLMQSANVMVDGNVLVKVDEPLIEEQHLSLVPDPVAEVADINSAGELDATTTESAMERNTCLLSQLQAPLARAPVALRLLKR